MHVKIESEGHGRGKVFIDGKELENVTYVSAALSVGEINTVAIGLIPDTVELDLKEAEVETKEGNESE